MCINCAVQKVQHEKLMENNSHSSVLHCESAAKESETIIF